ncbi:MAG: hypothetical protein HZA11_01655 [Nitrospirae bacterium]|nr:hypothetical protein [Nitrospirota bacterium]
MELKLTRHAKNRNRKIQATVFEIIECIENPDSHYVQDNGREVAIKALGNKLLKIVFRRSLSVCEIITIIDRNQ